MEQKKYNDLQVSANREIENMRMMKNQLAMRIVKNVVKCKINIITKYICFKN